PKRAVASSVPTKLLYQRLSWSIDVLQELRHLSTPPRRGIGHQPKPARGATPHLRQRLSSRHWGKGSASTVDLAREMVAVIAGRLPGRRIHVVADAAYHAKVLTALPRRVTWTTRLPRNATLHHRAPPRTGKRGGPRLKGDRIGKPAQAAVDAVWHLVEVARYGRCQNVSIAVLDCLWYGVFGPQ